MAQANFLYEQASDGAGLAMVASIFAERACARDEMAEDVRAAGLRVGTAGEISELLDGAVTHLGDVVMLECPQLDARGMAALARLDMRVARAGSQMVVMTSADALDDVFACLDQSGAQILVDCGRAERVVTLGRLLAGFSGARVRDLSEDDRSTLLRLTQQVDLLARKLEGLGEVSGVGLGADGGAFRFEAKKQGFKGPDAEAELVAPKRPPLPDPRLVRQIIAQRQARAKFFVADLFADPAWDMLLDLTAARAEHCRVSVTSLCIASGVPATTALRWIGQMTQAGLLMRVEDTGDRRRAFIALTDAAADAMARYFAEIGKGARSPV